MACWCRWIGQDGLSYDSFLIPRSDSKEPAVGVSDLYDIPTCRLLSTVSRQIILPVMKKRRWNETINREWRGAPDAPCSYMYWQSLLWRAESPCSVHSAVRVIGSNLAGCWLKSKFWEIIGSNSGIMQPGRWTAQVAIQVPETCCSSGHFDEECGRTGDPRTWQMDILVTSDDSFQLGCPSTWCGARERSIVFDSGCSGSSVVIFGHLYWWRPAMSLA